MRLQHLWLYPVVCVFFLGSIVMGVLAFLGNFPKTPSLHSLSIFNIESHSDLDFEFEYYSVGIYGLCSYTEADGRYVLHSCTTNERAPFYFELQDILDSTLDYPLAAKYSLGGLEKCMKAVWALLVVHIAINIIGLTLAAVGIVWSSLCGEIAIHLGVLSVVVNLVFSSIATAYGKSFVSKFNAGSGAARASFGTGGIVLLWVLFVFSYFLFAFITVAIKHRNRDSAAGGEVETIDIEVASEDKQQYKFHSSPQSTIEDQSQSSHTPGPPTRLPRVRREPLASPVSVRPQPQQLYPYYRVPANIPVHAYYMPPPTVATPQQRYPSSGTLPQKYPCLR